MSTIADCPLSGCNLNSLHLPGGAVIIFLNAFGECHPLARLVLQLQFHVTILAPSVMTPSRYPLMPTAPFAPSQHLLHAVPHPQH